MKNEKQNYYHIIIGIVIIAVVAYAVRGCGVHDNGGGVDAVRNELNAAESNQSAIAEGISNAERTAGDAEKTVSAAESTAIRIESGQREAEAIIADCQSIVRTVRERGKGEAKPP